MLNWIEEANKKSDSEIEIHSFSSYMKIFEKNTLRECRPSYIYLKDMFNSFGKDNLGSYELFTKSQEDIPPVYGQTKIQNSIYKNLENFSKEGMNNKFILLVGPNGSSKSSIVKKIIAGAEEYSKQDDGALFTFSWVFPIDNYVKGTLGLNTKQTSRELQSYALLEDKDITAILASELKDHPLLLIPLEYRQKIICEQLKDHPQELESIKKSYLFKGNLSKRNRMIYDAMLRNYKGDHEEVLKHIRVERFSISKRYSRGAVTIEPQLHVDARLQQITMDKRLASLPPSLQSLNLFSMQGEIVLSNRGILEFSDLLKRPLDTFKYLLMTMETGTINHQGILTELDIFFVGTSNEIHLAAFKQHPDFNSFKGRFTFIKVPYLLDYKNEVNIYKDQVKGLETKFEPHALNALCIFSIMTRLRACHEKNYENSKLGEIAKSLNPFEKCLLLSEGLLPERLDFESKQLLKSELTSIEDEYINENLYEGKFGLSPRDMKKLIYQITDRYENITCENVLDFLSNLVNEKNNYDFLNMNSQGDFHHPTRFIALLTEHILTKYDHELRDSLSLVDDRSYKDYIQKYIENINSLSKGDKIKNKFTGKFEECDEFFIKEFESNLELKENPEIYRSHLLSKLGAWFLDNPKSKIDYVNVFPELLKQLQESFRGEQLKVISTISNNIVFYQSEQSEDSDKETPLSKENKELIQNVIDNLMKKYYYSKRGAMALIQYTIKNKY